MRLIALRAAFETKLQGRDDWLSVVCTAVVTQIKANVDSKLTKERHMRVTQTVVFDDSCPRSKISHVHHRT